MLKYSKNYSKTSGSLCNYHGDEPNNPPANCNADPITNSASFKYKSSIIGKTPHNDNDDNNEIKDVEITVPLKHLGGFWRVLNIPLINCEVNFILTWSKNYVLTDMTRTAAHGDNPARAAPTGATFVLTDCKLYVPVVTFSTENDNKLLEQLKTGLKRTIKWNKYRSEMYNQAKNNNLNCLIDPTFTKVNRLFILSYENEEDRTSFSKYYVPSVEIKDVNVLIGGRPFFDIPIKIKKKHTNKIFEMSRNNDYTTGNLLDYDYYSTHYKLIAVNLSK